MPNQFGSLQFTFFDAAFLGTSLAPSSKCGHQRDLAAYLQLL